MSDFLLVAGKELRLSPPNVSLGRTKCGRQLVLKPHSSNRSR
ncbi:hypothetical protein LINPERPRIM_LOCUS31583 [Linum perenne]